MNEYLRLYPEREAQMRETVAYFDCINLAPWVKAPMLIYAGLNDDVCPPETAFDLKRALSGEVELHTHERCGHDAGAHWEMPVIEAFLARHLEPAIVNAHADVTVG
jgi:cephalosporin-C deacetylase